jgi:hypothetical protein
MKKLRQQGFSGIELILGIVLLVMISSTGYYVWHNRQHIVSTFSTPASDTTGCVNPPKKVFVDASIVTEGRAAFLAKGFSATWFDKHFQPISSTTNIDALTDASTGWKPKSQAVTILKYQMCVDDYTVSVNYNHADDANSKSSVSITAPAHDIHHVISAKDAENDLVKCGGKLATPPLNGLTFRDNQDSGAAFPNQTRLYLSGGIPSTSNNSAAEGNLSQSPTSFQGGIVKISVANIDIETGKCFVTTTTAGTN